MPVSMQYVQAEGLCLALSFNDYVYLARRCRVKLTGYQPAAPGRISFIAVDAASGNQFIEACADKRPNPFNMPRFGDRSINWVWAVPQSLDEDGLCAAYVDLDRNVFAHIASDGTVYIPYCNSETIVTTREQLEWVFDRIANNLDFTQAQVDACDKPSGVDENILTKVCQLLEVPRDLKAITNRITELKAQEEVISSVHELIHTVL